MKVCSKHRSEDKQELIAILKVLRDAGNCPCCGFKYHTANNSYYSSDKPPPSWKKHDNCCSVNNETDFLEKYYNPLEENLSMYTDKVTIPKTERPTTHVANSLSLSNSTHSTTCNMFSGDNNYLTGQEFRLFGGSYFY